MIICWLVVFFGSYKLVYQPISSRLILSALMINFYNLWVLPTFYMSTLALGVLSSRSFIGALSYLANINSFAELRLLLNQNGVDLVLRS